MKKSFQFRRSDTGEILEVFANGKNHAKAKAQALVALGPDAPAGVTLTPILPYNKSSKVLEFVNESRREKRVQEMLGFPVDTLYYP